MKFLFTTTSEKETRHIGEQLSRLLQPGDVVGLFGDLGSGKTHLIKGICTGLKCGEQVSSPSFALINQYQGEFPVYHFDFYRINSEAEIYELGYEEYFYGNGICLIEWAERVITFLPDEYIGIYLSGIYEKGKESMRKIDVSIIGSSLNTRKWASLKNYERANLPKKLEHVLI